ncbi:MAG: hypothetical protein AAFV53_26165 [Myxococcota bacterium]
MSASARYPITVWSYDIVDRDVEPILVAAPVQVSRHRSLNAAIRSAKSKAEACIMKGTMSITEVRDGDRVVSRWFKGPLFGPFGARLVPYELKGEIQVSGGEE